MQNSEMFEAPPPCLSRGSTPSFPGLDRLLRPEPARAARCVGGSRGDGSHFFRLLASEPAATGIVQQAPHGDCAHDFLVLGAFPE
jgi:hypothetical protein